MASPPSFVALLADSLWSSELENGADEDADVQNGDSSDSAEPARKKKRSSDSGSIDSADEVKEPVAKPKRRRRKATHTLRKEEKARLLKEMAVLHSQMEDLKARALQSCGQSGQSSTEKVAANRVLRRAIQSQQIDLARVHALMSEYFLFDTQAGSPTHHFIHLKRVENERHDTLQAMRDKVIMDARSYLDSRFPRMDALKPMREEHCFEAPNGDYCSHFAAVVQLEGATSVRQVFDSMIALICNIEISISERLGSITIREDDDRNVSGLMQNRLVSTTPSTRLLMESNYIYFARCEDCKGADGEVRTEGIVVCDFVDEDDLYPYDPVHRVRRDVSAVIQISSHPRRKSRGEGEIEGEEDEFEDVVVLKHWVNLRLHYPSFKVSSSGWRELRDCSERWLQIVRHAFHNGSDHL